MKSMRLKIAYLWGNKGGEVIREEHTHTHTLKIKKKKRAQSCFNGEKNEVIRKKKNRAHFKFIK